MQKQRKPRNTVSQHGLSKKNKNKSPATEKYKDLLASGIPRSRGSKIYGFSFHPAALPSSELAPRLRDCSLGGREGSAAPALHPDNSTLQRRDCFCFPIVPAKALELSHGEMDPTALPVPGHSLIVDLRYGVCPTRITD